MAGMSHQRPASIFLSVGFCLVFNYVSFLALRAITNE
jgi:hypothetical protein